jgi:hypothetical protein
MTGLRILVCGGRDYTDRARVDRILDRVHAERGIEAIIQGTARGADQLAAEWGWDRKVRVCSYPADWQMHGKKAGALRNQSMIDEGKPDAVIAFPGGAGTADMVKRSRDAGLPVWVIGP